MYFKDISNIPCRHCEKTNAQDNSSVQERHDYYGISTGYWCDDCYQHNYPYRKDAYYDYLNAGEYLEDNY